MRSTIDKAGLVVIPASIRDRADSLRAPRRWQIVSRNTLTASVYDAHIAEIARAIKATVIVTDNRRHFLAALRYGIRVETPAEFLAGLKKKTRQA